MAPMDLTPATEPTFYFVGVTTAKSSIMRVFPEWARHLGLGDCPIRGIDCKQHDDPEVYRRVVSFLRSDPLSLGGLVTTHKIDLLAAARDLFDALDPYAERLGEISSISKRDGALWGHAKDPITSGLSLEAFLPGDYWERTGAEMFLMGAGGSSLALTVYLMEKPEPGCWPGRVVVSNRSLPRLEAMEDIHARYNPGIRFEYVHAPSPEQNDAVLAALRPGSVVINATGLGKDAPGSPLTAAAVFPEDSIAWDFNYRGDLVFLDQARAQQAGRNVRIEDGWVYFLHGWTRVIAEVFHIEIPTSGPEFERLSEIAAGVRG
jgi:shikimate 5-dehydrogenase